MPDRFSPPPGTRVEPLDPDTYDAEPGDPAFVVRDEADDTIIATGETREQAILAAWQEYE